MTKSQRRVRLVKDLSPHEYYELEENFDISFPVDSYVVAALTKKEWRMICESGKVS